MEDQYSGLARAEDGFYEIHQESAFNFKRQRVGGNLGNLAAPGNLSGDPSSSSQSAPTHLAPNIAHILLMLLLLLLLIQLLLLPYNLLLLLLMLLLSLVVPPFLQSASMITHTPTLLLIRCLLLLLLLLLLWPIT